VPSRPRCQWILWRRVASWGHHQWFATWTKCCPSDLSLGWRSASKNGDGKTGDHSPTEKWDSPMQLGLCLLCKDCWCRFKWTLKHYLNPGDQVLTRMLPSDADLLHTATPTPSQVRSASGAFTIFLGPTPHRCHWLHVSVRLEHFRPIGCMLLVLTGISRSRIRLSKCMIPAFWC